MNGYRLILVSDVGERDGMALELDTVGGEQIAEVFEDGGTQTADGQVLCRPYRSR